jgi:hypothetical protein
LRGKCGRKNNKEEDKEKKTKQRNIQAKRSIMKAKNQR